MCQLRRCVPIPVLAVLKWITNQSPIALRRQASARNLGCRRKNLDEYFADQVLSFDAALTPAARRSALSAGPPTLGVAAHSQLLSAPGPLAMPMAEPEALWFESTNRPPSILNIIAMSGRISAKASAEPAPTPKAVTRYTSAA